MDIIKDVLDICSFVFFGIIIGHSFNKTLTPRFNGLLNIAVLTCVTTGVNYFMTYSQIGSALVPEYADRMSIKAIFLMAFWCVFAVAFYKDKLIKKVKAYIFMQIFIAVSEIFLGAVISGIFGLTAEELQYGGFTERLSMFLMALSEYAITGCGIYVVFKRKDLKIPDSAFATFSGIIFVACVMIGFVANSNSANNDTATTILLILSPLLLVVLCLLLYRVMRKLSEKEMLEQKLTMLENIKTIEMAYQTKLNEKNELVRRFRHDYKGNISTLEGLISSGNAEGTAKALELLESMSDRLDETEIKRFSDNITVNAIVSSICETAQKKGITIDAVADVPRDLSGIRIIDLNSLFVNLLNNAVEACDCLSDGADKTITLRAGVKAGFLVVKTINPYTKISVDENGNIKSTKSDENEHGIGLAIIKEICDKYDGDFSFETENGICTVTAGIKLN